MMDAGVEGRVMHMIFIQETNIFVHFKTSITSPFHILPTLCLSVTKVTQTVHNSVKRERCTSSEAV